MKIPAGCRQLTQQMGEVDQPLGHDVAHLTARRFVALPHAVHREQSAGQQRPALRRSTYRPPPARSARRRRSTFAPTRDRTARAFKDTIARALDGRLPPRGDALDLARGRHAWDEMQRDGQVQRQVVSRLARSPFVSGPGRSLAALSCPACASPSSLCSPCRDQSWGWLRSTAWVRGVRWGASVRRKLPGRTWPGWTPRTEAIARRRVADLAADAELADRLARECAEAAAEEYRRPSPRPGGVAFRVSDYQPR